MLRMLLAPARAGGRSVFNLVTASFGVFSRTDRRSWVPSCSPTCRASSGRWTRCSAASAQRAEQTYRILQAPETAFLVVAAPEPDAIREAGYFAGRLAR